MIKIRSSRVKKFKKNSSISSTIVRISSIFYLSILIISYLNGSTSAYFTDSNLVTGTIHIGTWEIAKPDSKVNESILETKQDKNLHTITESSKKIQNQSENNTGPKINNDNELEQESAIETNQAENQNENGYKSQNKQNPDEANL